MNWWMAGYAVMVLIVAYILYYWCGHGVTYEEDDWP